jgi:DNA-binding transcriptional MocR family regulator
VYPLALGYMQPPLEGDGIVLGYANLTESRIEQGVRLLAGVIEELSGASAADARSRDRAPALA